MLALLLLTPQSYVMLSLIMMLALLAWFADIDFGYLGLTIILSFGWFYTSTIKFYGRVLYRIFLITIWGYRIYCKPEILLRIKKSHLARAKKIINIKIYPDRYFEDAFDVPACVNLQRLYNITRDYNVVQNFINNNIKNVAQLSVDGQFLIHRIVILICSAVLEDKQCYWELFKGRYALTIWAVELMEQEFGGGVCEKIYFSVEKHA